MIEKIVDKKNKSKVLFVLTIILAGLPLIFSVINWADNSNHSVNFTKELIYMAFAINLASANMLGYGTILNDKDKVLTLILIMMVWFVFNSYLLGVIVSKPENYCFGHIFEGLVFLFTLVTCIFAYSVHKYLYK